MSPAKKERHKERHKERRRARSIARRTWVKHHGEIPFDEFGLSHHIHHIDGNPLNNDLSNLACLSYLEHYEIHFWQGDWNAIARMMNHLLFSSDEIIEAYRRRSDSFAGINHPNFDPTIHSFTNKRTGQTVEMTRFEFERSFDLNQTGVSDLISEKHRFTKNWVLTKNAHLPLPKEITGFDTIHRWRHRDTEEIIEATRKEMEIRFRIPNGNLYSVTRKTAQSAGGWELDTGLPIRPRVPNGTDRTIYRFQNQDSGEIIQATQGEMIKRNETSKSGISMLVTGKRKSHKGWTLIE